MGRLCDIGALWWLNTEERLTFDSQFPLHLQSALNRLQVVQNAADRPTLIHLQDLCMGITCSIIW